MTAVASAGLASGPVRLVTGALLGAVVAVALFAGMRYLILSDAPPPEEALEAPNINIVSRRGESDVIRRDDRPEEPDEVRAPPPPPRIEAAKAEQPQEGLASMLGRLPDINPDAISSDSIQFVVADRDVQPIVRIEPSYPMRAQERGLEGTCLMRFDVLPDGSVDESTVVADCTSSLFSRDASRAVARWKYNAKIVNGEAVVQRGIETVLDFQLADE
jgi:protein TonB